MILASTEVASLTPPVYFVSDAHLGAEPEPIASTQLSRLLALMDTVRDKHGALVINGDLFDFWFEWQTVIPKKYFRVLRALQEAVEAGTTIYMVAGNHDFRLSGFLEKEIGLRTVQDALVLQIADQKVYVFHGDGVLRSDRGYRFLRRVLRNPVSQRLFLWLHPDIGMSLARGTSMQSRNATKGNPDEDADYIAFAKAKLESGFQGVVMGHAHRPIRIEHNGGAYVNLGDWIYHYTYAIHDGQTLSLNKWQDDSVESGR